MKTLVAISALFIGMFLTLSCQKPGQSKFSDAENSAEIFVKTIAKPGSRVDLLIAVPNSSRYDRLDLCQSDDPDQCNTNSAQYSGIVNGLQIQGTSETFFLVKDVAIQIRMAFAIRAWNSADRNQKAWRVIYATDPNAPDTDLTEGTGGRKGSLARVNFSSSHGYGNSEYRVYAPASNSENQGHPLVVYLHGDTGSNYDDQVAPDNLKAYGQDRPTLDQARAESLNERLWNNVVFVAIKSPTINDEANRARDNQGRPVQLSRDPFLTWSTALTNNVLVRNANFVNEIVTEEIYEKYNIDTRKVFFFGQSGGGVFLGKTFIPAHGNNYRGGFGMLCGADRPRGGSTFAASESFKQSTKIHIEITTRESQNIARWAPQTRDYYRQILGNDSWVTYSDSKEGTHCQFNGVSQPSIMAPVIRSMATANRTPL